MKAQAVVAVAPGRVEHQEVTVPEPGAEDVVVRLQHSWISPGTERSMIRGERVNGETPRGVSDPVPFPHVPGYQKVGVVEWLGAAVRGYLGAVVFATVSRVDGMFFPTGGHVSPSVTHSSQIWSLPEHIPAVRFSGLVLAQVGYNCAMRPPISPGDAVVIIGDGLIGHWAAQTLHHRGARVLLIGRHDERLRFWGPSEHDRVVNARHQDPVDVAREWAMDGVQAVLDTVGSVPAIERFLPLVRRDGHIVSAGFHGTAGRIDIQHLRFRELSLHAPSGWTTQRMDATRDLIAEGVMQTEPLITHRFPV
jgi:2-desacetyl-2-hydroxyethyl bacteriochlorophyllide A dehydrogenase